MKGLAALAFILILTGPVLVFAQGANGQEQELDVPIEPVDGQAPGGSATVLAGGSQTDVTVRIGGLEPGTTHKSHIHRGDCSAPGEIAATLGDIVADAEGTGEAGSSVGTPMPFLANGQHTIDVHADGSEGSPVIACGVIPALTAATAPPSPAAPSPSPTNRGPLGGAVAGTGGPVDPRGVPVGVVTAATGVLASLSVAFVAIGALLRWGPLRFVGAAIATAPVEEGAVAPVRRRRRVSLRRLGAALVTLLSVAFLSTAVWERRTRD
jgi:hypothetical protein